MYVNVYMYIFITYISECIGILWRSECRKIIHAERTRWDTLRTFYQQHAETGNLLLVP